jgi:hypothetical protein
VDVRDRAFCRRSRKEGAKNGYLLLDEATSRTLALFRCTQVVLYPR